MTADSKIFLVKSALLERADTQKDFIEFGYAEQIIEISPSDLELLKNLLNEDITDWKESGDKYAEKREIQQDTRLLKKLEQL